MPESDLDLLKNIVKGRFADFNSFLLGFGTPDFPNWKVDKLCEWISEEFLAIGLDEDYEPNEYGVRLESLLDEVNRRRGEK